MIRPRLKLYMKVHEIEILIFSLFKDSPIDHLSNRLLNECIKLFISELLLNFFISVIF